MRGRLRELWADSTVTTIFDVKYRVSGHHSSGSCVREEYFKYSKVKDDDDNAQEEEEEEEKGPWAGLNHNATATEWAVTSHYSITFTL